VLGDPVGSFEGEFVGWGVTGLLLGAAVVGEADGGAVGLLEGVAKGAPVGLFDGAAVVGDADGGAGDSLSGATDSS